MNSHRRKTPWTELAILLKVLHRDFSYSLRKHLHELSHLLNHLLSTMSQGAGKEFRSVLERSVFSSIMTALNTKDNLNFTTACGKCFLCVSYHEVLLSTKWCRMHKLFLLYKEICYNNFQLSQHFTLSMYLQYVRQRPQETKI